MRQSKAAVALICRLRDGQKYWLAQWNPKWGAYHFVSGHRRDDESFRECVVREIAEELHLCAGADYRVALEPHHHLEFVDFSRSAHTKTHYIMELFTVVLGSGAHRDVEANPANRWLTDAEIEREQASDNRPVSPTMRRLLKALEPANK